MKSHPSNRVYAREHPTYVQCETNSSKDGKPMKPRAEERGAVTIGERSLLFFLFFTLLTTNLVMSRWFAAPYSRHLQRKDLPQSFVS